MNHLVGISTKISLLIQAITGLFSLYGLTIPLKSSDIILKEVLGLELVVQIIEFIFYIGFLYISSLSQLTQTRYYDWFLSTPVMLFTISLYFFYVNFIDVEDDNTSLEKPFKLFDFAINNISQLTAIILLNILMLLFGFLAELGIMNRSLAFILGSAALCGSFGIIYENYGKQSKKTRRIFWIMFGLWSLYGIAFLYPPVIKNIGYTVLDIFAKNFFGIFLSYTIYQKSVENTQ
jgi:bacteriorhodopsin